MLQPDLWNHFLNYYFKMSIFQSSSMMYKYQKTGKDTYTVYDIRMHIQLISYQYVLNETIGIEKDFTVFKLKFDSELKVFEVRRVLTVRQKNCVIKRTTVFKDGKEYHICICIEWNFSTDIINPMMR